MKQRLTHMRHARPLLAVGVLLIALFVAFVVQANPLSGDTLGSTVGPFLPGQVAATRLPSPRPPVLQSTRIRSSSTRTPAPSEFGTPPGVPAVASTRWPISQVIDLAGQLDEKDKAQIYVRRANGAIIVFLVSMETSITQLPLQAGDVVIQKVPPASLMGHEIHRPTVPATATKPPYPGP